MPSFPDKIAASHSCSSLTPMTCSRQSWSKPLVYSHNSTETVSGCLCEIQLLFSIPCFQMCFPYPSATHLQLALQYQIRWHTWKGRTPTHLLVAFASLRSVMSCAYPASGTSQFSTPSSLFSLPAFLLPGVLCFLCFTITTCLVLWAPSTWRLVTKATSMPPSGVTWTFHLPALGTVPSAAKLAQLHWLQQLSTSVVTQPRTSPRSLITHLLINASCDHWSDPQLG